MGMIWKILVRFLLSLGGSRISRTIRARNASTRLNNRRSWSASQDVGRRPWKPQIKKLRPEVISETWEIWSYTSHSFHTSVSSVRFDRMIATPRLSSWLKTSSPSHVRDHLVCHDPRPVVCRFCFPRRSKQRLWSLKTYCRICRDWFWSGPSKGFGSGVCSLNPGAPNQSVLV